MKRLSLRTTEKRIDREQESILQEGGLYTFKVYIIDIVLLIITIFIDLTIVIFLTIINFTIDSNEPTVKKLEC